jgi:hypothetical protein
LSGVTSRLKQVAVDGDPQRLGDALQKVTAAPPGEPGKKPQPTNEGSK